MMKLSFKIPILLVALSFINSCSEKVEHNFYYSDGTLIRDTADIRLVSKEIAGVLEANELKSLKIESSLYPSYYFSCPKLIDSLRDGIKENLIERYPKYTKWIEKMDPDWLLSYSIIVVDNQTGQIVGYEKNQAERDVVFDVPIEGTSNKIYGFLIAMDKEYGVDDDYVYWQESHGHYADGRKDTTREARSYPIKFLFGTSTRGPIRRYPYQDYSKEDWKKYNEKMDFKLMDDSVSPEYAIAHQSKFFDLVRTFAMINNGGKQFLSGFVRKVVDSDKKIVYTSNCIGASLVSKQTLKEMNELLKYNMLWGYGEGGFVKKNLSLDDDHLAFFGGSGGSIDWILCSNKKHTIGIITTTRLHILVPGKGMQYLHLSKWNVPRKGLPILGFVLKQLKGIELK